MSISAESELKTALPESVRAEAAVWVARLHCDVRSEHTEGGFRLWLAERPIHRDAFERMTNTWEATAGLRRGTTRNRGRSRELWRSFRYKAAAAAATLVLCTLLAAGALAWMRTTAIEPQVYTTVLGERRSLLLPDGSHLVLNTQSRVTVSYTNKTRRLTLDCGQARFDVAREPARPFVVRAGSKQVIALGTAFDVRFTDERLSIVLLDGQVAVVPAGERPVATSASATILRPGERLQFDRPDLGVKSSVRLEREEAWVSGRVIFDSTPLGVAVAEINRYAPRRIVLADPALATLQISGTFSVDDPAAIAGALAQMFALEITSANGNIVLMRRKSRAVDLR
jgi:transmembrane sensor